MHRAALLAFGMLLAIGRAWPRRKGCRRESSPRRKRAAPSSSRPASAELGDNIDFTVLNKTGFNAGLQHCDFVTVARAMRPAGSPPRFARSRATPYPDLFAILEKKNGDLSVTRMTVQQPSYDQTEEEPALSLDDLDPSEIGRDQGAGDGDGQAPEEALPEPETAPRRASTPISAATDVKP